MSPMTMTTTTMNDENKPRNNLVAESDLQGALKAIEISFQELKNKALEQETDENGTAVLSILLKRAQESLVSHVQRLVEPVSDAAYHEHLQRNIVEDDSDDSEQESDDDEPISDDEFEEEELLDREVLQRARVLRQQVREASERASKLRSSVTDRAVSVAQREAALLVGPTNKPMKPYDAAAMARRLEQPFSGEKSEKLMEMEESLKSLTLSLQEMDGKVPDTMETLQETIDTIQMAMEQGTSLSQTERAIRSRSNEGSNLSQDTGTVTPEARLGTFLGQH